MDETTFLKCLIDENRRAILRVLEGGERSAGEIADELGMEQSLCSHHLAKLRNCGLVRADQRGRSVIYTIAEDSLPPLLENLQRVSTCIGDEGDGCGGNECG